MDIRYHPGIYSIGLSIRNVIPRFSETNVTLFSQHFNSRQSYGHSFWQHFERPKIAAITYHKSISFYTTFYTYPSVFLNTRTNTRAHTHTGTHPRTLSHSRCTAHMSEFLDARLAFRILLRSYSRDTLHKQKGKSSLD